MELWWRVRGWSRYRLTSADCAGRLREISRENRLEEVRIDNDLTAEFTVVRGVVPGIRQDEALDLIGSGGLPVFLERLWRWRIAVGAVVLLAMLTLFLQTRILFVSVEGNGVVPARLILERAEECGVYFGARSRELRSEQVKNHLLWAIPELRWAGVNVQGCTAVITVAVRQEEPEQEVAGPGDIVSCRDAVVTELYPQAGTAAAARGQAVREGQVLISGTTDLGLTIRQERAEGEVYGLTRHSVDAALTEQTVLRTETGRVVRKYALLIGKKYVNFSNDSGILYGTCVKMRTVDYLKLPGGFRLPVALVTDTYQLCQIETAPRSDSRELMADAARRYVREQMTAGAIRTEEWIFGNGYLTAEFDCRELIGVFRPGTITEGDTNDRENRERGAG